MGIEDLSLDTGADQDRILIISSDPDATLRVLELLVERPYHVHTVKNLDEASARATSELFDLLIMLVPSPEESAIQHLLDLSSRQELLSSAILFIHPAAERLTADQLPPVVRELHLLGYPAEPSKLLVKISGMLRLRKLRAEDARFYSGVAEKNAQLRDLTNRFKHELREAQSIQQSILPRELPSPYGIRLAAVYAPLEAVGGDLYDIWMIDAEEPADRPAGSNGEPLRGRVGFFIGDVTGHGLSAALIGAMTKMALSYAEKSGPERILTEMNNGMSNHIPDGRFVTALCAIYDTETGTLSVARGGHPPVFIYRAQTGQVELLAPKGLPLGVIKGSGYERQETVLHPGDMCLLVTDGLTETSDLDGTLIGNTGVEKLITTLAAEHPIEKVIEIILEEQQEFTGGRQIKDDTTLIGIERLREE